jgi:DNA-binding transcriptional LysR family regulator
LDESIKNRSGAATGKLRITAPMSFGKVQLSSALIDFAQAYPGIELDVSFNDRVVNLVDEGSDVGVRIGNASDSSLIARRLCSARIFIAASPPIWQCMANLPHHQIWLFTTAWLTPNSAIPSSGGFANTPHRNGSLSM